MSASSSFKFLLLCFISSIFLSLHVTNIDFSALYFVDVDILYAAGIQLVYSGTTLNFIYATFEIKKTNGFFRHHFRSLCSIEYKAHKFICLTLLHIFVIIFVLPLEQFLFPWIAEKRSCNKNAIKSDNNLYSLRLSSARTNAWPRLYRLNVIFFFRSFFAPIVVITSLMNEWKYCFKTDHSPHALPHMLRTEIIFKNAAPHSEKDLFHGSWNRIFSTIVEKIYFQKSNESDSSRIDPAS